MPFLGVQPTDTFAAVAKQTITGDGSTTYTLTHSVASANDLAVFVNNVRQEPTTAYSASGTSITFTEAIASTDSCYVVYIARTFQTLSPPDNSVNADQISYPLTNFSSTGIDDNADAVAITIDSSEQVGIGTTSPSSYYAKNLVVSAGSEGGVTIASTNTTNNNYLHFADGTSGDARYRGQIGYAHNTDQLSVSSSGTTVFNSGSSRAERMRILAGGGITFNGDTAAANALDDYETGTWTPAYGASSGSYSSVTYANQIGTYAKVGDIVTAHGRIDTTGSSIGTASGYLLITGFPYASATSAYMSGPVAYSWGFSSVHPTAVSFQGSSSSAYLFAVDRATTTGSIVPSNLPSGSTSYLYFGITYRTT